MAAGRGTRISRYIDNLPKCMLEIAPRKPLICNTLETLIKNGVSPSDIMLIVGYSANVVLDAVRPYGTRTMVNPFFDVTNSIASLWFAVDYLDSSFIALNGDTYFGFESLEMFERSQSEFTLLGDSSRIEEADYKLKWSNSGIIEKFGKKLSVEETTGEYVGLARVNVAGLGRFKARLEHFISRGHHGLWWEDVIYSFTEEEGPAEVVDIMGQFWSEIDYIEDYQRILAHVRK